MKPRTKYQEKIIRNFYDNREAISLQRLQELVTELYLSEGKKLEKNWEQVEKHLEQLGVARARIDHLIQQRNPTLVAEVTQQLFAKAK